MNSDRNENNFQLCLLIDYRSTVYRLFEKTEHRRGKCISNDATKSFLHFLALQFSGSYRILEIQKV